MPSKKRKNKKKSTTTIGSSNTAVPPAQGGVESAATSATSDTSTIRIRNAQELESKGTAAFQAGNYSKAEKLLTEAIEKDPSNVDGWFNRSKIYMFLKCFKPALDDCLKAASLSSSPIPEIHLHLAQCFLSLGLFSKAYETLALFSISAPLIQLLRDNHVIQVEKLMTRLDPLMEHYRNFTANSMKAENRAKARLELMACINAVDATGDELPLEWREWLNDADLAVTAVWLDTSNSNSFKMDPDEDIDMIKHVGRSKLLEKMVPHAPTIKADDDIQIFPQSVKDADQALVFISPARESLTLIANISKTYQDRLEEDAEFKREMKTNMDQFAKDLLEIRKVIEEQRHIIEEHGHRIQDLEKDGDWLRGNLHTMAKGSSNVSPMGIAKAIKQRNLIDSAQQHFARQLNLVPEAVVFRMKLGSRNAPLADRVAAAKALFVAKNIPPPTDEVLLLLSDNSKRYLGNSYAHDRFDKGYYEDIVDQEPGNKQLISIIAL